jgi:hypothetical protein
MSENPSPAAQNSISLSDLAQKYLGSYQRLFDIASVTVEGMRQVNESSYDQFSSSVRFLPSQPQHRNYETAKGEAERWILKNLLGDALGLIMPFMEDVRSVAELARWNAGGTQNKAEVEKILSEDRRAFFQMSVQDKFAHLQNQIGISSPLSGEVQSLIKASFCLLQRGGVVAQEDTTDGSNLAFTLLALQLVPTKPEEAGEAGQQSPVLSARVGEVKRSFPIGQSIKLEKADYLNILTTLSMFVSSIMKSLQEKMVGTQRPAGANGPG